MQVPYPPILRKGLAELFFGQSLDQTQSNEIDCKFIFSLKRWHPCSAVDIATQNRKGIRFVEGDLFLDPDPIFL